ncbi:MAG: flagellar type III secretion system pore protein FliP [Acidimicrobiia bacterium]
MITYLKRVWAFRNASLRDPGTAGKIHRSLKMASVITWMAVFVLAHRAGAQEATSTTASPVASVQLPSIGASDPSSTDPAVSAAAADAAALQSSSGQIPAAIASIGAQQFAIPAAVATGAATPSISVPSVQDPTGTIAPGEVTEPATIGIDLGTQADKPSTSVMIIVGLTLLSLAPSLLIMMTSFTRMVIVLGLTRNAIGLQSIPPNQVVVGLALFLSLFVMSPTLTKMNDQALQPLLHGEISQGEAVDRGTQPLKQFMLANTRRAELQMMISASKEERPATAEKVSMTTLIPAFVLSELKTAFIIGFVIFIPFLVIDLVVSSVLMAMGMMMLPPAFVALPFKRLWFVMVDGWSLVAKSLVESFR